MGINSTIAKAWHGAGARIARVGGRIAGPGTREGFAIQRLDDLLPLLERAGFNAQGGVLSGTQAGRSLGKSQAVKELLGYAYGAMSAFSGLVISTKMEVQTKSVSETGAAQWEPEDAHPLSDLLRKVNPLMTWPELMSLTSSYVFAVGSAFWLKKFEGTEVASLWPLPAQNMKAKMSGGELLHWEQTIPNRGEPIKWAPEEIVHFVDPIPGKLDGFGKVQAAAGGVNLMAEIVNAQYNTMVNGGLPSLFVWLKEKDHKKAKEQMEAIQQKLQGSDGKGTVLGLSGTRGGDAIGDTDIEQVNKTTANEMGFDASTQLARDLELGSMGMPQALLGITRDTAKANVDGAEFIAAKYTVNPWIIKFDARVNQDLVIPHYGEDVRIQHDSPVPRDVELDLKEAETRLKLGDSWNAVAAERGWPSHPWGDTWYAPIGVQPVDGEQPPPNEEQQMFLSELNVAAVRIGMSPRETQKMIATAAVVKRNGHQPRPVTVLAAKPEVVISPLPRAIIQAPRGFDKTVRRRLERLAWRQRTPLRLAMREAVQKYFREIEKRLLAAFDVAFPEQQAVRTLQTDEEARQLDAIINTTMDPEATAELLAQRTAPFTARGIVLGGEFARNLFDASLPEFDFDSRAAQRYAAEWSDAYWPELTRRQQREIKQVVLRGIEQQAGLGQIRNDIQGRFSSWIDLPRGRAMAIATTETTKMYNAGSQAFMEEAGVDFKQWVTSFVRSRDAHMAADGQPKPVNQNYQVGGESLVYPGQGSIPGNNINCHCISVPIPAPTNR